MAKARIELGSKGKGSASSPYFICRTRKVDIRLSGKGDSNFYGARPVHYHHLDD